MSSLLTMQVKNRAGELGSDLVGVGSIDRWDTCPILMSPAGIMPGAKSVVVCGMHHADGMVEMGGEESAHVQGPYVYQMFMNHHLDYISYQMGRFLDTAGYRAIPIAASNIWRYRPYKDLTAIFAPDISNIYAAVAAGLAELGYNGLALTPQYGPRNRFVSIITDAPLTPDGLLPGDTLCDRCGMCEKYCDEKCAGALVKELKGTVALEIDGHTYPRADKNLWRCAWAEHFSLDVDIPRPEKVDEQVILEIINRCGMKPGGAMGMCLKYCLPKQIRTWDRDYTSAPRRTKTVVPAGAIPRSFGERLVAEMVSDGVELVAVEGRDKWNSRGVDIRQYLPDAENVMLLAVAGADGGKSADLRTIDFSWVRKNIVEKHCFFASRRLEDMGYNVAPHVIGPDNKEMLSAAQDALGKAPAAATFLVTNAPLETRTTVASGPAAPVPADLTAHVKELSLQLGADMVGISSASRLDSIIGQLGEIFEGESVLEAGDSNPRSMPYEPEIVEKKKHILRPEDYVAGAKSVIVLGLALPSASVERAAAPPAEAVGPYVFAQYQSQRIVQSAAWKLVRELSRMGFQAVASYDLTASASTVGNPRGEQPDVFCNRFAALCAGLGTLGKGGFLVSPRFGPNVRFAAVVTDAQLAEDALDAGRDVATRCKSCSKCLEACTVCAHRSEATIEIEGQSVSFQPVEQNRCDWAKRYALVGDEGFKFAGSKTDVPPPQEITADALAAALRQTDPILKFRPCSVEKCAVACPLAKRSQMGR